MSGAKNFTIPLLEDSSMENDSRRKQFIKHMLTLSEIFSDCIFSFEAELGIESLEEIVSSHKNFAVTYDTGNITSYGLDHPTYIDHFRNKINNVHLKDRTYDAVTVSPLTGDTDFRTIFDCLKNIEYGGSFIIQTAREDDGQEVDTIRNHMQIFKDLYDV